MFWIKVLAFKLLVHMHTVHSLRLLMLDIPSPTIFGESVELQCSYELDDDQLYSVKFYKNDVEFYRYVPNDWPPGQFLPIPGIKVDLSRSGKDHVFLRQIDLKSEGMYRCEVSAEAPEFKTAELEKEMKVFLLPTEGPRITGSKAKYQVGDDVKINCTSALSKPAANLKWSINDQQAPSHYEKTYPLKILSESGLEQVTLGLHFTINSNHFLRGELRMRCTASIHRVYAMSTHAFGTLLGVHNHTRPFHPNDVYKGKHNHNPVLLGKAGDHKKDADNRWKTVTTTRPKLISAITSNSSIQLRPFNSCLLIGLALFAILSALTGANALNDFIESSWPAANFRARISFRRENR